MLERRRLFSLVAGAGSVLVALACPVITSAQADTITLVGASQFGDEHPFNKTMIKFAELVEQYYGEPIEFVLHGNMQLGNEKDYINYMSRGVSVDYAVVAPTDLASFSPKVSFFDTPFLFRDHDHWEKVLSGDTLKPIADEIFEKADVMILGYPGGGVRNLMTKQPVRTVAELKNLEVRVMNAPIQSQIFAALGAAPTPLPYNELYNALETGVVQAAENEANGINQMKFYEVTPYVNLTEHSITVRMLAFSGNTFQHLPEKLQAAILKAGLEASTYGRELESSQDASVLKAMADKGQIQIVEFTERDELLKLAEPVKQSAAEAIGATEVLNSINAVQ